MLKKTIRRLGALAMVLAMAVSVFAVNASATAITAVPVTKNLTKEANTYAPNTAFSFKVEAGKAGTYVDEKGKSFPVTAGAAGDWTLDDITVAGDATATTATGSKNLTLKQGAYTAPGIYSYKVSEVKGDYDGMSYSDVVKNVYVFVNNDLEVYAVNVVDIVDGVGKTGTGKNDFTFNNTLATKPLTLKKVITGNQSVNTAFEFKITITADSKAQLTGSKEQYYAVITADGKETVQTLTDGEEATISLKNNETVKIYGLSASDTYTIVETKANADGYTTTVSGDSFDVDAEGNEVNGQVSGKVTTDNAIITYTNTKDATSPTGVIMNIAPYALMVVLAGAFAVVFLTRRNRAE